MKDNTLAKESRLSTRLHEILDGHYVRIENTIGRGTPDVAYSVGCDEYCKHFWIELKVDEGEGTLIRPEQRVFFERELRQKCHCLVITHRPEDNSYLLFQYPFDTEFVKKKKRFRITSEPKYTTTKLRDINTILNATK